VKGFASLLQKKSISSWIDDRDNGPFMKHSIIEGIKNSQIFIACLTQNYNEKIKGGQGGATRDWCYYELNFATWALPPKNVFLVILEKEMIQRENWCSYLQAEFANRLFFDLTESPKAEAEDETPDGWQKLITEIRNITKSSTSL
jgi:hypothetical protein